MNLNKVLVYDFGRNENQKLARKIRDLGIYSEIEPISNIKDIGNRISAVIISGKIEDEKKLDKLSLDKLDEANIPIMQVYQDRNSLKIIKNGLEKSLTKKEFFESYLEKYLFEDLKLVKNWNMKDYIDYLVEQIRSQVKDERVLLALSGGVDSSVTAALIQRAIGDRLTCIFVDHGLMRKNEAQEVMEIYKGLNLNVKMVDASDRFLEKLKGVSNPEQKRKIIGEGFIRIFEEEARKLGKIKYLGQGTIYPDVIESGIGGELVKSHHNVGGLPKDLGFEGLVEPLRMLFKDEVRKLGLELGMPEKMIFRQPFPGPGLGVRVVGEIKEEYLTILKEADYIMREEIEKAGLDRDIWQYFAGFFPIKSVGIKDGKRAYDYVIALRAVSTTDAMEVRPYEIPYEILTKISTRIIEEVDGVARVVYDISKKPPGTIEWE